MKRPGRDVDEAEDKQPRAVEAMECPGLEHPGLNKRSGGNKTTEEGDPTLRTGTSGVEQATRAAARHTASSGTSSTSPHPLDRSGRSTQDDDTEEQRHRAEDEVGGMQSSKEVAGPRESREVDERASPR